MTADLTDRRARIARAFTEAIPFARRLGMRLDEVTGGRAVLEMPQSSELVGDPETGVIHGGVIFTLMDTCCGAAVMCHETMALSTATLDLRFVRATAWDEDLTRPVAMATGAFAVVRE